MANEVLGNMENIIRGLPGAVILTQGAFAEGWLRGQQLRMQHELSKLQMQQLQQALEFERELFPLRKQAAELDIAAQKLNLAQAQFNFELAQRLAPLQEEAAKLDITLRQEQHRQFVYANQMTKLQLEQFQKDLRTAEHLKSLIDTASSKIARIQQLRMIISQKATKGEDISKELEELWQLQGEVMDTATKSLSLFSTITTPSLQQTFAASMDLFNKYAFAPVDLSQSTGIDAGKIVLDIIMSDPEFQVVVNDIMKDESIPPDKKNDAIRQAAMVFFANMMQRDPNKATAILMSGILFTPQSPANVLQSVLTTSRGLTQLNVQTQQLRMKLDADFLKLVTKLGFEQAKWKEQQALRKEELALKREAIELGWYRARTSRMVAIANAVRQKDAAARADFALLLRFWSHIRQTYAAAQKQGFLTPDEARLLSALLSGIQGAFSNPKYNQLFERGLDDIATGKRTSEQVAEELANQIPAQEWLRFGANVNTTLSNLEDAMLLEAPPFMLPGGGVGAVPSAGTPVPQPEGVPFAVPTERFVPAPPVPIPVAPTAPAAPAISYAVPPATFVPEGQVGAIRPGFQQPYAEMQPTLAGRISGIYQGIPNENFTRIVDAIAKTFNLTPAERQSVETQLSNFLTPQNVYLHGARFVYDFGNRRPDLYQHLSMPDLVLNYFLQGTAQIVTDVIRRRKGGQAPKGKPEETYAYVLQNLSQKLGDPILWGISAVPIEQPKKQQQKTPIFGQVPGGTTAPTPTPTATRQPTTMAAEPTTLERLARGTLSLQSEWELTVPTRYGFLQRTFYRLPMEFAKSFHWGTWANIKDETAVKSFVITLFNNVFNRKWQQLYSIFQSTIPSPNTPKYQLFIRELGQFVQAVVDTVTSGMIGRGAEFFYHYRSHPNDNAWLAFRIRPTSQRNVYDVTVYNVVKTPRHRQAEWQVVANFQVVKGGRAR